MRYTAILEGQDNRPEKVAGKKAPKGGWRTTKGIRKVGRKATIDADSFSDAVTAAAALVGKLKPATQKQVTRIVVALDKASPESGGNPFEE